VNRRTLLILTALAVLSIAGRTHHLWTVAGIKRAFGFTGAWVERAERFPHPTLSSVSRASLILEGARIEARQVGARVHERISLGVDSTVVRILQTDDHLYVATFDEGLFAISGFETNAPRVERLELDLRTNDLARGPDGTLWVATNGGAYRVRREGAAEHVASGSFTAVTVWRGAPVFASRRGLTFLEANGARTVGAAHGVGADNPAALAVCGDALCIGATDGLWRYDGHSARRLSSASGALPTDWVTAVAAEGDVTWVGTFDAGVSELSQGNARRISTRSGLADGRVFPNALVAMNKVAYLGTPTGLVAIHGETVSRWTVPDVASITAVAIAARGGLWVGAEGFVVRVTEAGGSEA
jgi:ligand-binding sensor domain-containing protein